ncbi:MAG TPA: hypothetical protein DCZ95_15970 [Verrucomicrobia bacterium]|nr:MAG: hypothetical protein A2X46_06780 [Lentisphaerae bacterium GWF2_57_35]HBA85580.1 hypothetical protein [Verrucomicrobiota bacterium]
MKRIMITGASGALGSEILPQLQLMGQVLGLGYRNLLEGLQAGDIRDEQFLSGLLKEVRPEVVIHCAAYRDPDFCDAQPEEARRLNVRPVQVMNEVLPASSMIVFISSDYVFDGRNPPYREESPCSPINLYGQTKVEAEELLAGRKRKLILRVPLLVGAEGKGRPKGFLGQAVEAILSGVPVELDDVLVRYPTWTRDVAEALRFLLEQEAEGVWHFSGDLRGTRYSITREIAGILGKSADHIQPSQTIVPRRAQRPPDAHLDDAKIRVQGFRGPTGFRQVVEACRMKPFG